MGKCQTTSVDSDEDYCFRKALLFDPALALEPELTREIMPKLKQNFIDLLDAVKTVNMDNQSSLKPTVLAITDRTDGGS
jgi:hypothetical protein